MGLQVLPSVTWTLPTLQEAGEQPSGGQGQLCHHAHCRAIESGGDAAGQPSGLEPGLLLRL